MSGAGGRENLTPPCYATCRPCSNTCTRFNQSRRVFEPQSVWGASLRQGFGWLRQSETRVKAARRSSKSEGGLHYTPLNEDKFLLRLPSA